MDPYFGLNFRQKCRARLVAWVAEIVQAAFRGEMARAEREGYKKGHERGYREGKRDEWDRVGVACLKAEGF